MDEDTRWGDEYSPLVTTGLTEPITVEETPWELKPSGAIYSCGDSSYHGTYRFQIDTAGERLRFQQNKWNGGQVSWSTYAFVELENFPPESGLRFITTLPDETAYEGPGCGEDPVAIRASVSSFTTTFTGEYSKPLAVNSSTVKSGFYIEYPTSSGTTRTALTVGQSYKVYIDPDVLVTPPQDLTVIFPKTLDDPILPAITAWGKNPKLVNGTPWDGDGGNKWNWQVEILDPDLTQVLASQTYLEDADNLNPTLFFNYTQYDLDPAGDYRIRVTASNNFSATAVVTSPPKPEKPFLWTPDPAYDSGTSFYMYWAKPEYIEGVTEEIRVKVGENGEYMDKVAYTSSTGESIVQRESLSYNNKTRGVMAPVVITNTYDGGVVVSDTEYITIPPGNFSVTETWSADNSTLTISVAPTTDGYEALEGFLIAARYNNSGEPFAQVVGGRELAIDNTDPKIGKYIYLVVKPIVGGVPLNMNSIFRVVTVKPVAIGIYKTCDGDKNIVEMVEKKGDLIKRGKQMLIIKSFDVEFYVDGELYATQKTCEGHQVVLPEDPPATEAGDFAYWVEVTED